MIATRLVLVVGVTLLMTATGCKTSNHYVIAATGTVIGVEIAQDPKTQVPTAKLGYNRGELALVPTGRPRCVQKDDDSLDCGPSGGKASDSANVVMELRYGGIFDTGASSGIYQRLAVGSDAVKQPGASLMFIKNADGNVDPNAAMALAALTSVQASETGDPLAQLACLNKAYAAASQSDKTKYDEAAAGAGFADYKAFGKTAASSSNNGKVIAELDKVSLQHGCSN